MKRATIDVHATLAFALVALSLALPVLEVRAEPASSPAGFYKVDCLGNSDTIVSIPFTRPEAAFALVQSVAGSVVTVQGAPGWSADQFVYASGTQSNTYYLRFLSGPKEGSYYPILDNDANTLTLDLTGDDISSVTNGTRLAVIPYWTLATAFPGGKGVIASSSSLNRITEVLIPDFSGNGVNLSPTTTYFFLTNATFPNGDWRRVGEGTVTKNDNILLPDVYFIVRHNTSAGTVFTAHGSVPTSKLMIPVVTQQSTKQDNFVALTRPTTVTLDQAGLFESGAFLASSSALNRSDELFVFDNGQAAINKAPSETYYYLNTWRRVGSGTTDMGNQPVFLPGTGVIIRKNATTGGLSSFWINSPTY